METGETNITVWVAILERRYSEVSAPESSTLERAEEFIPIIGKRIGLPIAYEKATGRIWVDTPEPLSRDDLADAAVAKRHEDEAARVVDEARDLVPGGAE